MDGSKNSAANLLIGGAGNDTYIVGTGDIIQEDVGGGIDSVQSSVTYTLGENVENLTIVGDPAAGRNGYGNASDNVIRGTTQTSLPDIYGFYGNNVLSGGAGNDSLYGEGQIDTLYGGDGDDTLYGDSSSIAVALHGGDYLDGGAGNDALLGFSGSDTYFGFTATSGLDSITDDAGATDRIEFANTANINIEALQFSRIGNDLKIAVDGDNAITIKSWYAAAGNVVETLTVHNNGVRYDYTAMQVQGRADGVNSGPVANSIAGQNAATGLLFQFALPATAFVDIESQFSMSYAATLADGSALPAWLVFDSATRTFTGTPPAGSLGSMSLRVIATDAGNLSASTNFALNIAQGPIVGTAGNDTLTGDATDDVIDGLAGNDTLYGLGGNDELLGDIGDDVLDGGVGNDYLEGSEGNDTLYGQDGIDELSGDEGSDQLYGGAGDDVQTGDFSWDNETFGNDLLDGGAGADEMDGGYGDDIYVVDNVNDFVF